MVTFAQAANLHHPDFTAAMAQHVGLPPEPEANLRRKGGWRRGPGQPWVIWVCLCYLLPMAVLCFGVASAASSIVWSALGGTLALATLLACLLLFVRVVRRMWWKKLYRGSVGLNPW